MSFRYDFAPTPFGDAIAVHSPDGLIAFDLPEDDGAHMPWALEGIARRLGADPVHEPGSAGALLPLLDDYFDGVPVRFDERIRLDWSLAHGFARAALQEVCRIPWGETASYGEVAVRAGRPGAARAVGTACRVTPFSIVVPVHRVVRADGSAGEYGAHPERKTFLIALESDGAPAWPGAEPEAGGEAEPGSGRRSSRRVGRRDERTAAPLPRAPFPPQW